jgi:hypothetical protein
LKAALLIRYGGGAHGAHPVQVSAGEEGAAPAEITLPRAKANGINKVCYINVFFPMLPCHSIGRSEKDWTSINEN